jgi:hypothetical protein
MSSSRVLSSVSVPALRLVEESAAGKYLEARRAWVAAGARLLSVARLVVEQPGRADYRQARERLRVAHTDAAERCHRAWQTWQQAQRQTDAAWTATTGRTRTTTAPDTAPAA